MSDTDNKQDVVDTSVANSEIPDWARKSISEANAEAAKYRNQVKTIADETATKLNAEWESKLKSVAEEKTAALSERDNSSLEYTKLKVALNSGVSADKAVDFAGLLQGSNEEELSAYAQKVLQFGGAQKPAKATDPTQGMTGGGTGDSLADAFGALFKNNLTPR